MLFGGDDGFGRFVGGGAGVGLGEALVASSVRLAKAPGVLACTESTPAVVMAREKEVWPLALVTSLLTPWS